MNNIESKFTYIPDLPLKPQTSTTAKSQDVYSGSNVVLAVSPVNAVKQTVYCEGEIIPTTTIVSSRCENGCWFEDSCIPFGTRVKLDNAPSYCDIDRTIKPQEEMEEFCMNDYECKSNDCSDSKCVSTYNLLQRILDFLKNIFGFRVSNVIEAMRRG